MAKWFRIGLDITRAAYQTEFGRRVQLHDDISHWLETNCRDAYRMKMNVRKKRSPIVGYIEPKIFIDVTMKRKTDAAMFKMFFADNVTTSCRCKAP